MEILSTGTEHRDRGYKKILYGRYGVRESWIVDPIGRRVEVHTLTQAGLELRGSFTGEETVESTLVPALELAAESIFPPPSG